MGASIGVPYPSDDHPGHQEAHSLGHASDPLSISIPVPLANLYYNEYADQDSRLWNSRVDFTGCQAHDFGLNYKNVRGRMDIPKHLVMAHKKAMAAEPPAPDALSELAVVMSSDATGNAIQCPALPSKTRTRKIIDIIDATLQRSDVAISNSLGWRSAIDIWDRVMQNNPQLKPWHLIDAASGTVSSDGSDSLLLEEEFLKTPRGEPLDQTLANISFGKTPQAPKVKVANITMSMSSGKQGRKVRSQSKVLKSHGTMSQKKARSPNISIEEWETPNEADVMLDQRDHHIAEMEVLAKINQTMLAGGQGTLDSTEPPCPNTTKLDATALNALDSGKTQVVVEVPSQITSESVDDVSSTHTTLDDRAPPEGTTPSEGSMTREDSVLFETIERLLSPTGSAASPTTRTPKSRASTSLLTELEHVPRMQRNAMAESLRAEAFNRRESFLSAIKSTGEESVATLLGIPIKGSIDQASKGKSMSTDKPKAPPSFKRPMRPIAIPSSPPQSGPCSPVEEVRVESNQADKKRVRSPQAETEMFAALLGETIKLTKPKSKKHQVRVAIKTPTQRTVHEKKLREATKHYVAQLLLKEIDFAAEKHGIIDEVEKSKKLHQILAPTAVPVDFESLAISGEKIGGTTGSAPAPTTLMNNSSMKFITNSPLRPASPTRMKRYFEAPVLVKDKDKGNQTMKTAQNWKQSCASLKIQPMPSNQIADELQGQPKPGLANPSSPSPCTNSLSVMQDHRMASLEHIQSAELGVPKADPSGRDFKNAIKTAISDPKTSAEKLRVLAEGCRFPVSPKTQKDIQGFQQRWKNMETACAIASPSIMATSESLTIKPKRVKRSLSPSDLVHSREECNRLMASKEKEKIKASEPSESFQPNSPASRPSSANLRMGGPIIAKGPKFAQFLKGIADPGSDSESLPACRPSSGSMRLSGPATIQGKVAQLLQAVANPGSDPGNATEENQSEKMGKKMEGTVASSSISESSGKSDGAVPEHEPGAFAQSFPSASAEKPGSPAVPEYELYDWLEFSGNQETRGKRRHDMLMGMVSDMQLVDENHDGNQETRGKRRHDMLIGMVSDMQLVEGNHDGNQETSRHDMITGMVSDMELVDENHDGNQETREKSRHDMLMGMVSDMHLVEENHDNKADPHDDQEDEVHGDKNEEEKNASTNDVRNAGSPRVTFKDEHGALTEVLGPREEDHDKFRHPTVKFSAKPEDEAQTQLENSFGRLGPMDIQQPDRVVFDGSRRVQKTIKRPKKSKQMDSKEGAKKKSAGPIACYHFSIKALERNYKQSQHELNKFRSGELISSETLVRDAAEHALNLKPSSKGLDGGPLNRNPGVRGKEGPSMGFDKGHWSARFGTKQKH